MLSGVRLDVVVSYRIHDCVVVVPGIPVDVLSEPGVVSAGSQIEDDVFVICSTPDAPGGMVTNDIRSLG